MFKKKKNNVKFLTQSALEDYNERTVNVEYEDLPFGMMNMILSQNFKRPLASRKTIGNDNVLIVDGDGKNIDEYYTIPNLLQMNSSYVVADPEGHIYEAVGKALENNGYKVKVLNFIDMDHSDKYNPMSYILSEGREVHDLVNCFFKNYDKNNAIDSEEDSQENTEHILYMACVLYLKFHCTDEQKVNLASVSDMLKLPSDFTNNSKMSPLDKVFEKLPGDSIAYEYYACFKRKAGMEWKAYYKSCADKLNIFSSPKIASMMQKDTLELNKMGKEKTALFVIFPKDNPYKCITSMLYKQIWNVLLYEGEKRYDATNSSRLKIPVQIMMNNLSSLGYLQRFITSSFAFCHKYNISFTVSIQSIGQLIDAVGKEMYKPFVYNFYTVMYSQSRDYDTVEFFAEILEKTFSDWDAQMKNKRKTKHVKLLDQLFNLPPEMCIIDSRCKNSKPILDYKYDLKTHPKYNIIENS